MADPTPTDVGRYTKRPVTIEAAQVTPQNMLRLAKWCGGQARTTGRIIITTLEGEMEAQRGDWIIKGVQGEFYPCKPDIFDATYREADDD